MFVYLRSWLWIEATNCWRLKAVFCKICGWYSLLIQSNIESNVVWLNPMRFSSTCVTGRQGCLVPLGIWSNFWYMYCNSTYEIDYCALALSFWCTYDMCGIIVNLFKFVWNKDHIPILKSCIITFEYCLLKQIRSQSVDYVST